MASETKVTTNGPDDFVPGTDVRYVQHWQLRFDGEFIADTAQPELAKVYERIVGLAEQVRTLHTTLRKLAIEPDMPFREAMLRCRLCSHSWAASQPERHSADCLAATEMEKP